MATALRRRISAMSFTPPYRYVTADTLAQALLKQKSQGQQQSQRRVAVVDVRDDDFEGGNIVGAVNVPSTTFDERVQALATKDLKDVPTVVFHCSLSQQRGPKSARIYSEARKAALEAGKIQPLKPSANESESDADAVAIDGLTEAEAATAKNKENGGQAILVLRDGFANFGRLHKDDSRLVEAYDEESWMWR